MKRFIGNLLGICCMVGFLTFMAVANLKAFIIMVGVLVPFFYVINRK